MTHTSPAPFRLSGISPRSYEHPADRAATAALRQIPYIDQVVRKLFEFGVERAYRQGLLANGIRIGPQQLPTLWHTFQDCFQTLDMEGRNDLYILQTPEANAMAFGAEKPLVVLNSGLVGMLDNDELKAVIAHEVGHIHSEHVLYGTVLHLLLAVGLGNSPLPLAGLPLQVIQVVLLEWWRAAELSCDRASALVVRDPLVTCRTLMKLAGGSVAGLNVEAFIQQASAYEAWDDSLDRAMRFLPELSSTHPFAVRRVSELLRWIRSGEYERILGGTYVRRGQEPSPTAEFSRAVDHYAASFSTLIQEAGGGVQQVARGLSDWLRNL